MASMFKEFQVFLKGGLNNYNEPTTIDVDQLQTAIGMEYRPSRLGLFATPGRVQFDIGLSATATQSIHAIGYLLNSAGLGEGVTAAGAISQQSYSAALVAMSGSTAFYTSATGSGTFLKIDNGAGFFTPSATAYGDFVCDRNQWFYYNGVDKNAMLIFNPSTPSLFAFAHGFIPVTASGTAAATGGTTGSLAAGTYQLWWTEATLGPGLITHQDEFKESAYIGNPTTVVLSASGLRINFFQAAAYVASAGINQNIFYRNMYCTQANGKYPYGFLQWGKDDGYHNQVVLGGSTSWAVSALDTNFPYDVVAPVGGVPVSMRTPAPPAYAMRSFQDCMVCIPSLNRFQINWSFPGDHHSWPITNVSVPNEKVADQLNAIEVCNDHLLVFSGLHGFRYSNLPQASDAYDFTTSSGRLVEKFLDGHGCVSPRGTTVFTTPEGLELCAFICRDGLHLTDGQHVDYASTDLDWENMWDVVNLSTATLKNNPKRSRVEMYGPAKVSGGAAATYQRVDFYYHPLLIKRRGPGIVRMPALGPHPAPGIAAALTLDSNNSIQMFVGDKSSGRVWKEATGTTDGANLFDASGGIQKDWKTREFAYGGLNGEFELYKAYTHQSQTTASGSYTITMRGIVDDQVTAFQTTATVDQSRVGAIGHPDLHARLQHFNISGGKDDGGAWQELDYLVFVVKAPTELMGGQTQ